MTNTTITKFRENLFAFIKQAVTYNSPVTITTKDGNAVVISEEEYNGMLATLALTSEPGLTERILQARDAPDSDFIPMEDMAWE